MRLCLFALIFFTSRLCVTAFAHREVFEEERQFIFTAKLCKHSANDGFGDFVVGVQEILARVYPDESGCAPDYTLSADQDDMAQHIAANLAGQHLDSPAW